jgi:hypothetical protein
MNFVNRNIQQLRANKSLLKEEFLADVKMTVEMEEILPQLVLNWDQTGFLVHL